MRSTATGEQRVGAERHGGRASQLTSLHMLQEARVPIWYYASKVCRQQIKQGNEEEDGQAESPSDKEPLGLPW